MSNGRILIVDDEPQIRRVLRAALTVQGYETFGAKAGEEALLKLREQRFDLVLLDVNMPGMGGLETCRQIRATSEIAVLMLTIRNSEADKVAALDAGADDYITKPFGMPELLARIRAALRRVPAAQQSEDVLLRLGDITVDFATRRVIRDGQEVRLTPKEFDVLRFLTATPHIAIPHTRLLQAVWGPDYGGEVEYLRVFVNQLRKKIEPDPTHPRYLLTEPRVGYRFVPPAR